MKRNTFTAILVLALVLVMGTVLVSFKDKPKLPVASDRIVGHVVDETLWTFIVCNEYVNEIASGVAPATVELAMKPDMIATYADYWNLPEEVVDATVAASRKSISAKVKDEDNTNTRNLVFTNIEWDAAGKASSGNFDFSTTGRADGVSFSMQVKGSFDFSKEAGSIVFSSVKFRGTQYDVENFNYKIR